MTLREEWKLLRPQLGSFLGKLCDTVENTNDIDEFMDNVRRRAYNKGYEKGCADTRHKDICTNCKKKEFYTQYHAGCGDMLEKFGQLHPTSKRVILDMINRLSEVEHD